MEFEPPARNNALESEDGVLPLINIVFLLLVFFMIAGSLSSATPFPMEPVTSSSESEKESHTHKILLGSNGQLALDNVTVSREKMLETIASIVNSGSGFRLQINAHAQADARELVILFEQLREHGVDKIQLLTTHTPAQTSTDL